MSTISSNPNQQNTGQVLVSIVVPFYNSARFLRETLESVEKQDYTAWECLLVDDGSTDDSATIAREFQKNDNRFRYLKRKKEPKGVSTSRNEGISHSLGKYLLFLDADDLLSPFCLKHRVQYIEQNPSLNFVVFQIELFGLRKMKMTTPHKNYLESFVRFDFPWTVSSPIWKSEFLKSLGGFNTNLTLFEDPELHIRALLKSSEFDVLVDIEPDMFYRQWKHFAIFKSEIYKRDLYALLQYLRALSKLIKSSHLDMKILRNGYFLLLTKLIIPIEQWEYELLDDRLEETKRDGIIGPIKFKVLKSMLYLLKTNQSRILHRLLLMVMQLITTPLRFFTMYIDVLKSKL